MCLCDIINKLFIACDTFTRRREKWRLRSELQQSPLLVQVSALGRKSKL